MHMFNDGYYMGGMHGGWWLIWLLALLAVGAAVLLVRQRTGGSTGVSRESPQEVLRHRLARRARSQMSHQPPCMPPM